MLEAQREFESQVQEETFPSELQNALEGDGLSESDEAILSQDGPIVTYESESAGGL